MERKIKENENKRGIEGEKKREKGREKEGEVKKIRDEREKNIKK